MKSRVKNRADPRYKNIQSRLNNVIEDFVRCGKMMKLQVRTVSFRAKINPSTFYNHYTDMDEAVNYMNTRMGKELHKLKNEIEYESTLEIVFLKILFFIYKNSNYYRIVIVSKNISSLNQITVIFRSKICSGWNHYKEEDIKRIFRLFQGEFVGLIIFWGQSENFKKSRIPSYAKKMAKLCETACERLR